MIPSQALESFTRVPTAALSMVHRNNFISWLNNQWTLSTASPSTSAEEEKTTYVRLVEHVVISLVAAVTGQEETDRPWVSAVERFVMKASDEAGDLFLYMDLEIVLKRGLA